jgi:hypothetical protein
VSDYRTSPLAAVAHRTQPASAAIDSGWTTLDGLGVDVIRTPLVDTATTSRGAAYARLTYRDALAWCAENDYMLLGADHLEQCRAQAQITLRPATLPPTAAMGSLAWSIEHDRIVAGELARHGYDGSGIVLGIGKHWVAGAPAGRSHLMGWWVPNVAAYGSTRTGPGWVQPRPAVGSRGAHTDDHVDYSSTTLVVRPTVALHGLLDVAALTQALALVRGMFLGSEPTVEPGRAIVAVAAGYAERGLREATGRNDGAAIAELFRGCTRNVGGRELPTGWASGWDWCAAFASWCVHVALGLPVGAVVPVGRRIAVRELVEDARACGRLETSRAYRPRPGDLWIGARAGGDPLLGGTGHVRVFAEHVDASTYRGIGGNEGNRVRDAVHRYDDATWRAWIATTQSASAHSL